MNLHFQDPSILTNVVDTIQSLLNFLTYYQDLILEVMKKVSCLVKLVNE